MAYSHILAHMRIRLCDKAVKFHAVAQIRTGQIIAELHELVAESLRGVKACGAGIGHFELVVDKHVDILFKRLRLNLLGVVLVI